MHEDVKKLSQEYINAMFDKSKGDTIPPVALLLDYCSKELTVVQLEMGSEQDKNNSAFLLRSVVAKNPGTSAVVFIAESWKATPKPHEDAFLKGLSPSQRPDREEGVMVVYEFRDAPGFAEWVPIYRDPNVLGEVEEIQTGNMIGRFSGLFLSKETMQ